MSFTEQKVDDATCAFSHVCTAASIVASKWRKTHPHHIWKRQLWGLRMDDFQDGFVFLIICMQKRPKARLTSGKSYSLLKFICSHWRWLPLVTCLHCTPLSPVVSWYEISNSCHVTHLGCVCKFVTAENQSNHLCIPVKEKLGGRRSCIMETTCFVLIGVALSASLGPLICTSSGVVFFVCVKAVPTRRMCWIKWSLTVWYHLICDETSCCLVLTSTGSRASATLAWRSACSLPAQIHWSIGSSLLACWWETTLWNVTRSGSALTHVWNYTPHRSESGCMGSKIEGSLHEACINFALLQIYSLSIQTRSLHLWRHA